MSDDKNKVISLLEEIVSGKDRGETIARSLVTAILVQFPDADDDKRFEDLMHILASFKPGGGEFLYGEEQLAKECAWTLGELTKK